jgi:hypothetical protein
MSLLTELYDSHSEFLGAINIPRLTALVPRMIRGRSIVCALKPIASRLTSRLIFSIYDSRFTIYQL